MLRIFGTKIEEEPAGQRKSFTEEQLKFFYLLGFRWGDQIVGNKMDRICSTHFEVINACEILI
jgi:hypothetical protein